MGPEIWYFGSQIWGTLGDLFFSPHTYLGVDKYHGLGNKIWGTLGDVVLLFLILVYRNKVART
jgi:hypothetical protein